MEVFVVLVSDLEQFWRDFGFRSKSLYAALPTAKAASLEDGDGKLEMAHAGKKDSHCSR